MTYTLLTGASSGIGYELAQVFAAHGHNLILVARSEQKLKELKIQLEKEFTLSKSEVVALDLSKPDSAEKLFEITESKGWTVDILVNNAGFGDHGAFVKSDLKKNQEMIDLNILTLTKLCHLYLPKMIQNRNGKILNVASTASFQPGPLMSVYYATKAYVLHFTEGLHEELQGTGVTAMALCPGATASGFQAAANLSNVALLDTLKIPTSKDVAEYAYVALKKNKVVAIHGKLNWLFAVSAGFLPRAIVRKVAKKLQEKRNN
ncbi:MAG: short-chain dehydrogenase/reductase [Pseudobdellovibrio sp.]|jgi:short-subunit dehydrogenase|nr:short-chain dehydrogenase/reductase [Pseudobdellovibrio sp.]